MLITIGENTKTQMRRLGIEEYPFTIDEVRISFRNAIKKAHPIYGGTNKEAREVIEAYKYLLPLCLTSNKNPEEALKEQEEAQEKDMFTIYKKCPICGGSGFSRIIRTYKNNCINCSSVPMRMYIYRRRYHSCLERWCPAKPVTYRNECRHCNGTGKVEFDPFNPVIRKGAIII